jgi:hypothetical protein
MRMKPGRDWFVSKTAGTDAGTGVYEQIATWFR